MKNNDKKPVLLSGVQSSGDIHIGNYLGAIKQWVELQDSYDEFVFIANLHAITVPQDPEKLQKQILETAAIYLALGIDPKKSTLFVQSEVPEHTELMWILTTVASMGDLERMVSFKEKVAEGKEALAGLFLYPVLMAADILLYKPKHVPVGQDQVQHIELARELARRFNTRFAEIFPIPEPMLPNMGAKILSLADPTKKMSKSHGLANYVGLFDSPDEIRKKFKSAVTDSGKDVTYDESRPGISNLISLYHLFSGKEISDIEQDFEGKGYGDFKTALAEVVVQALEPIQMRAKELSADPAYIRAVLEEGNDKARQTASKTLKEVYQAVGLSIT
jgi:tryptophanyl-tRNA synthetase